MNSIRPDFVEQFLISFLNRAGAVVEKPGYGLAEVLLPEELAASFQREELLLAFDYEVARENPGSNYVTPGSHLLDQAVLMAREYGKYTVQFWPGKEVIFPKNLDKKISQAVTYLHCRSPRVTGLWAAENIYYAFHFLCAFRSYEKEEEMFSVVVNGCSGLPCPEFEESWQRLIPLEKAEYVLGRAPILSLAQLYEAACSGVRPQIQKKAQIMRKASARLAEREQYKTNRYYGEVISEIEARLKSATDQAKIERLQKKLEATRSEWERREKDIASRYEIEAELQLDHLVAYFTPSLFINVELQHKRSFLHHCLIFNLLLGNIEAPKCDCCGKATHTLVPGNNGVLSCPDCPG
jgi:hypothetical protein